MKKLLLQFLLPIFLLASAPLNAAIVTWTNGNATGIWGDPLNWSTGAIPGIADVATFNASSAANCSMNVNGNVQGIDIQGTYSGTLTQQPGITLSVGTAGFIQAAGTFQGGNASITLATSTFNLSGGVFNSTSGALTFSGNFGINATVFTHSAGVFNHNNGTVNFNNGNSGCASRTYTVDVIPATAFFNVSLSAAPACGNNTVFASAAGDTLDVDNQFTHSDGTINAQIELQGNLILGSNIDGGTGFILMNGTGAQTYSYSGSQRTCRLRVNKSSGGVSPLGGTTELSVAQFELTMGSFTAPSGNFRVGGSQSSSTIFTHSAGTYTHNNGTLTFDPAVPGCVAGAYVIDVIPATAFYNVVLNGTQSCGNLSNISSAAGDTIDATNDFTHTDGVFNGLAQFKNDLIIGSSADGGSGTLIADGTGAQEYSVNPAAPRTAHLIVNKSSGALTPAIGTTALSLTKFSLLQGDFTAPSGNFRVGGSQSSSTIFTHSAGTFSHNNGTTTFDPAVPGCVAGAYVIDVIPSTAFYNVVLNGTQSCGNLSNISLAAGDTIDATNDFTHTDGVFNGLAQFKNDLIIGSSADGGSGTLIADGTGAQEYSVDPAAPRTAHLIVNKSSGALTPAIGTTALSLTKFSLLQGDFTAPTGNFRIGGSQSSSTIFTHSAGTFSHNNGTTTFDPAVPGCVAGAYVIDVIPSTSFHNVVLNGTQSCGNLSNISSAAGDTIDATNDFTHTDGVFNGLAQFKNDLIIGSSADGGSGTLIADGTGAQEYSVDPAAPRTAHLIVNKSSGALTPAIGTTALSLTKFSLLQGDFTAPSGNFRIGGSQSSSTIFTHSAGTFSHNNGTTTFDPAVPGCVAGAYVIDVIPSTAFHDVVLNGTQSCGNLSNISSAAGDTIDATNDFTHTDGVFNGIASFKNNLIIGSGADGGAGTLIADGAGAQTYSVAVAAPRTAHLIVNKTAGSLGPEVGTTALSLTKFSLLQGDFIAPTGNFRVGGSQSSSTIFTHSAGTFTHNGGTTIFDPAVPGCVAGAYTVNLIPSTQFFNVILSGTQSCGNLANISTAAGDSIDASNDFTHTDGVFNGIAQFKRDLYINAGADGGAGTIVADGTGAQTYNVDPSAPRTAHLVVNKTSNALSPGTGVTLLSLTKFSLLQGNFIAPTGNLRIGGSQSTSTIYNQTGGVFSHNSGTVIFDPQVPGCVAGTYTIDVIPATLFNYVTLSGTQSCGNNANFSTAAGDTIDALLDLTHADGVFNGLAATRENLIINSGSDGGTGSFIFSGTGNQSYTVDPAAPRSPNIVVRKGTGTVTPGLGTTNFSIRGLTIAQGSFDAPSGILNLNSNFSNSGIFNHNNAVVTFGGTSIQTISGTSVTTFYTINASNAANVSLSQNCSIENNLNFTAGRFVINGRRLTLGLACTISGNTSARYIQTNGLASGLGVEKAFSSGTANFTFPVGTFARYAPVNYDITANGAPGTIVLQPVTGAHPSTTTAANTQLNFYWKVSETGFSGLAVTHIYNYTQADVNGAEGSYVTGRFVNPLWTPLGGIAGTVNSVANTMTLTGVNFLVGDYTAGLTTEFQNAPAVVISAAPAGPICSGTNVTFTAVPTNGGASPSYQWQLNGVNVGTNSTTYSNNSLADADVVTCLLTSSIPSSVPNPATSNPIVMSVTTTVTPAISISALPGNTVCSGTSVSFTASITDGGTSPSFQWQLNGGNVGANSPSYTLVTPANGDLVTCTLTSNATCISTPTANAAPVTLTVNPSVVPSVSVTANPPGGICTGTPVTFTAAPVNGGSIPTYQWRLNGVNVGLNSDTYSNNSLANGDVVTCTLTSSETCGLPSVVTSSNLTMVVDVILVPSVSIAANPGSTICAGTSVTFTPSPTNGGGSPVYEWFVNSVSQGFGPTFTTATLINGDIVDAVLTSSLTCAVPATANSNQITMTVNPTVPVSVSVSASPGVSFCAGTNITFTATPTNGGVSPDYQWRLNGAPVGSNSDTYSNSTLVNGDQVTVEMTSSVACPSPLVANGNVLTMIVTSPVTPTITISEAQFNLCSGGIDYSSISTDEGPTPAYQWQLNGVDILGETNPTLTMPGLVDGDVITCDLYTSLSCAVSMVTSNPLVVDLTGAQTTWLGLSTTWNSPANWSSGVPNSSVSAVIPAGTPFHPIAIAPAFAYDLTVNPGATLEIAAGSVLGVYGNFTNNGTFTPNNGTLSFLNCAGTGPTIHQAGSTNATQTGFFNLTLNDASGLILNEDISVASILTISNGDFNTGGNIVTLTSNATRTGRIGPLTVGTFTGTITMQRFAPGGQTGWCLLGSPINTTIASWQDDFATSGFTGSTGWAGGFISIYGYDETAPNLFDDVASYIPATNVTNAITPGQGKWVYLGDGFTTTNDILIDVTGTPHTGNFDFNPSFTSSGGLSEDGWNLVANPFPSAIDWDAASGWTKSNMDDAIYMYQADNGQYATYVAGVGTNGGTRFIASSQGFYVKANAASPVLQAQETVKSSNSATLIRSEQSASSSNVLRLTMKDNSNQRTDEVVLRYHPNATPNFDGGFDALKFYSTNDTRSSLAFAFNNKEYSIFSSQPLYGESFEIPVVVKATNNGTYSFSFNLEQFELPYCIVLFDKLTGNQIPIEQGLVYEFDSELGKHNHRFSIKISSPAELVITPGTCEDANHGTVSFVDNSADGYQFDILNSENEKVAEGNTNGNPISNLSTGNYTVVYHHPVCDKMEQTFFLNNAPSVNADFEALYLGNRQWKFVNTGSENGNRLWDFGDGQSLISRQKEVTHTYGNAEQVNVKLFINNDFCSDEKVMSLSSEMVLANQLTLEIKQLDGVLMLDLGSKEATLANVRIFSASGSLLLDYPQTNLNPGMNKLILPEMANGIYLVKVNFKGKEFLEKILR